MVKRTAALAALTAVLLSSCTSKEGGSPTGVPDPTGTTSKTAAPPSSDADALPTDGAPKVDQPLTLGKFIEEPCSALTAPQAADLGVGFPGKADTSPFGPICVWTNTDSGYINLGFDPDQRGLTGVYQSHKAGYLKYFKEQPDISGYPAVVAMTDDDRGHGMCVLDVGVRDDTIFSVYLRQSRGKIGSIDPCQVVVRIAEHVLQTVKAGG